jgi:sporulation protein YlmC with PRC-barrel domain
MMSRASDFASLRVVDEDGRALGHLLDLRVSEGGHSAGTALPVDAIVCGNIGLLERAGLRAPGETVISWRDVVSVRAGLMVVRTARKSPRRGKS